MNIFILDENPRIAAQYHCDKHVIKMITETAQILSTAIPSYYIDGQNCPIEFYKPTHINHPCVKWAKASWANICWLSLLGRELVNEYQYRYGKLDNFIRAKQIFRFVNPDSSGITKITPFTLCMPDEFKVDSDPILSYRNYYKHGKSHLLTYTKRKPPLWLSP